MMGVRAGNHTVQVWNSVLPVPVVSLWGLINQESDGTLVTVVLTFRKYLFTYHDAVM